MSRRYVTYAVLLVASVVVTACTQSTAPTRTDTTCKSIILGSGYKCTT